MSQQPTQQQQQQQPAAGGSGSGSGGGTSSSNSSKVDPLGVSVVAQLFDAEEGHIITAMDSYANFVFLGYESGALQRLEIQFDPSDPTNIFTSITQTDMGMPRRKHRIKQLVHSAVEPFLIVLCHQQLLILHSESFRVIKQVAVDVGCCSLSLATPQSLLATSGGAGNKTTRASVASAASDHPLAANKPPGTAAAAARSSSSIFGNNRLVHRICSSEKEARGLSVHEFCFETGQLRQSVDNFVFPERVRCVAEVNGFLYVGLSREYSVLSMETGDVRRLVPLNGCTPQIAICDPHFGYFLLESVVFSVAVDRMPQSSHASVIPFEGNAATPNCFTVRPGALFAFTDRHCIVYSTMLQKQLQKLAIPDCQFVSHNPCEVLLPPPFGGTTVKDQLAPLPAAVAATSAAATSGTTTAAAANESAAASTTTAATKSTAVSAKYSHEFYPLQEVPASLVFVASKSRLHLLRMFPVEKQLRELVVRRFRVDCAEDLLRGHMRSPVLSAATEMLERLVKIMAGFSRLRRGLVEEGLATFASLVDVRQTLRIVPSLVAGTEFTTLRRPTFLAALVNCPLRCAEAFLFRRSAVGASIMAQHQRQQQRHQQDQSPEKPHENAADTAIGDAVDEQQQPIGSVPALSAAAGCCGHGAAEQCPHEAALGFIHGLVVTTVTGEDTANVDGPFWHEWHTPAIVQPPAVLKARQDGGPGAPPLFYDAKIESLEAEWEQRIDFDKVAALHGGSGSGNSAAAASSSPRATPAGIFSGGRAGGGASAGAPASSGTPGYVKTEMIRRELNNLWSRLRISLQGYLSIFVEDAARGNLLDPSIASAGARRAAEYALLVLLLLGGTEQQRHEAVLSAVRGDIAVTARPKKSARGSMAAAAAAARAASSPSLTQETLQDGSASVTSGHTLAPRNLQQHAPSVVGISAAAASSHFAAALATVQDFQPMQYRPLHRIPNTETYPVVALLRSSEFLPLRDCVGLFAASHEWRLMLLLARRRNRVPAAWAMLPWMQPGAGEEQQQQQQQLVYPSECIVPRSRVERVLREHISASSGSGDGSAAREFFTRRLSVWRAMEQAGVECPASVLDWCRAALDCPELPDGIRSSGSSSTDAAVAGAGGSNTSDGNNSNSGGEGRPSFIVDDAHPALIALEHLDFSELRNINRADPAVIERLRDSDGLTVLHHLVFLLAHSQVEERIDVMLAHENAAAKRERAEGGDVSPSSLSPSPSAASGGGSVVRGYSGGTKVSGPVKEQRMRAITNLVRFFVAECGVDIEVRAPCVADKDGNLLCLTAAEFALALSFTGANVGSSIRFVHAQDSATIVGALCAARLQRG